MTLEEKFEEAKKLYKDANADQRYALEQLFPELKESEDDEIMIQQLTEYFTTGKGLQNTNETVVEWLNDIKEKLSHVERKQKWSEEDDKKLRDCIYAIKNTYYVGCDELIHWLRDITNN